MNDVGNFNGHCRYRGSERLNLCVLKSAGARDADFRACWERDSW